MEILTLRVVEQEQYAHMRRGRLDRHLKLFSICLRKISSGGGMSRDRNVSAFLPL